MHPLTSSLLLLAMKTSDDFIGHRPVTSEIPDYDSDPFRLIANAEEKLVNLYHMNLQGNPEMTTAIKNALNEAGVVHTRHAYFDLIEFIEENLKEDQLRANVTNSLAWMADVTAINLARAMFFRDYKESTGEEGGDRQAYDTFLENFLSTLDVEEGGSEFVDGVARDLICVLGYAPQLHDIASAAQSAINREYNPRSFEALLAAEKPAPVKPLARAKLAQVAKFVEGEDAKEDQLQQTLEVLIARAESQAQRSHENRVRINPIVLGLIDVAKRHQRDDIAFHELDSQLQERLVKATITGINSAIGRLATYDSIEMVQFAMIMKEAKAAVTQLEGVLATYRTQEEDATIKAQQRQARIAEAKARTATPEQKEEAAAEASRAAAKDLGIKPDVGLPTNGNSYAVLADAAGKAGINDARAEQVETKK